MIERITIYGSSSIGVFCLATDSYVILPPDVADKTLKVIEEVLGVPVVQTRIGGSVLIGALAIGNDNGVLLPYYASDEELSFLKSTLQVNVSTLPSKKTALGNVILANDHAAVTHPGLESKAKRIIEDVLGVEVVDAQIAGLPIVGAAAVITNKGGLVHPLVSEEELKNISDIFKVNVDVGTVNAGFPFVGIGIVANSRGALVGSATTGPELAHIERALGLLEGPP
ncbi:MAG: translation initiation factor IF-6 [Candidatus Methanomethylicota archaeon]|uniref:Translation initiation factor 6 n=1 Tax=Thermoproteota archaeon TaxID=2056631 RepID=A0A497F988_9CREN|nr:MAG: translation initiation factor IF-6 [Candidatus Verstraetearchaeota archaeon]RLE55907.1 MAG: translation initiation factor IF-6 [Candidatus Verstraetearchaeota archaeon]